MPGLSKIRLLRTSAFRLALRGAGFTLAGTVIMFFIIYKASEGAVRGEIDRTSRSEMADVLADAQSGAQSMAQTVQAETADSPGTFYALAGPDGRIVAGNLPLPAGTLNGLDGSATIAAGPGLALPAHVIALRGVVSRLPGGQALFVGQTANGLIALDRLIARAFVGIILITLLAGLAAGLAVARSSLKRVEAISDASREIMAGDFARRIALDGSGDEFDDLAASLNAMLARIQDLMENLRQVTGDVAHDLRSPLARLRERLELLRRGAGAVELQALDEAIGQADHCLAIFAAILRISEIEAGARRRGFGEFDLSRCLNDLAETFETVAEAEGQVFSARIEAGLTAIGDAELLTQMFVNVIENALRHTPAGTAIMLRAWAAAGGAVVTIADSGPGIPARDRGRVLQRFVRLDASRHTAGTGLGLAMVAAIAGLHGIDIRLDDNAPGLMVTLSFAGAAAMRPAVAQAV